MSTRGAYGFRLHGQDKITYNHDDSDPEGLGRALVEWLHLHPPATWRSVAERIRLIDDTQPATPADIARYQSWADPSVRSGDLTDWYVLLRGAQGNPYAWDAGLDVMIDSHDFLQDSAFCEWGYVIDLDARQLEVYIGGVRDPAAQAPRYAVSHPTPRGFWGCQQLVAFSLDTLPPPDAFVARCHTLADALIAADDA